MSRSAPIPFFPVPPREYSPEYMSELTRAFYLALDLIQNPGEGRNTFIVLTDLQTDDYGLEVGASFQQDGLLKITLANKPHARGSAATGYVGLVTVSTP